MLEPTLTHHIFHSIHLLDRLMIFQEEKHHQSMDFLHIFLISHHNLEILEQRLISLPFGLSQSDLKTSLPFIWRYLHLFSLLF